MIPDLYSFYFNSSNPFIPARCFARYMQSPASILPLPFTSAASSMIVSKPETPSRCFARYMQSAASTLPSPFTSPFKSIVKLPLLIECGIGLHWGVVSVSVVTFRLSGVDDLMGPSAMKVTFATSTLPFRPGFWVWYAMRVIDPLAASSVFASSVSKSELQHAVDTMTTLGS